MGLTSCTLLRVFRTFLLRCLCLFFFFWPRFEPPTPRLGQQQPQLESTVPYNFARVYQVDVCALCLFKSHTHTHTQTGAHPLWPGTPCGKSWWHGTGRGKVRQGETRQARCPPLPYRSSLPSLWHAEFSSLSLSISRSLSLFHQGIFLLDWKIV